MLGEAFSSLDVTNAGNNVSQLTFGSASIDLRGEFTADDFSVVTSGTGDNVSTTISMVYSPVFPIGAEIELQIFSPNLQNPISDPLQVTVSDDVEVLSSNIVSRGNSRIVKHTFDISSDSIFYEVSPSAGSGRFTRGSFNGYVFNDVFDVLPAFTNVTIKEENNTLGLQPSDVTFTENQIYINVESLSYSPGKTFELDIDFADDSLPSILPSANFVGAEIEMATVSPSRNYPPLETRIATVDNNVEFIRATTDSDPTDGFYEGGYNVNISENSILYTAASVPRQISSNPRFTSREFNGYVFTDISDTLPAIENVTIDWSETTFRLSTSDVTFTENSIAINFEGLSYTGGDTVKLDVTFASEEDAYEENDNLLGAYDLSNNANTWLSDLSGEGIARDEDWYKLTVSSNNQRLIVDLEFTHTDGDLNLSLYDENANFILGSSSLTDNEQIDTVLAESGTYYLKVDPVGIPNEPNTYDLRWNV
ncbi:MAG: hypothetical protein F6J98_16005 [Moorea sp. SIO4G2]|nr:hypothetical protein [Moorena sp. SIO4G2]